jgi:hypothetical protein
MGCQEEIDSSQKKATRNNKGDKIAFPYFARGWRVKTALTMKVPCLTHRQTSNSDRMASYRIDLILL